MFDDLRCSYPLPLEGANALDYQTKDLDCLRDKYEIRPDGGLWKETYYVEDQSPRTKWRNEHPNEELPENLKGIEGMFGCAARVPTGAELVQYSGELYFYTTIGKDHSGWIEWIADFVNGRITGLRLKENRPPKVPSP